MNCPRCHALIPADGPGGMCPKCLLSVGLGEPEVVLTASGDPAPPPPTPLELEPYFPQFEILRLVGRGGMGAVYEARQKGLARSVALKILAAPTRADSSFEERFVREAQALARLSHENIVAVFDAGRAGPHFFLAMEYVDGPNLRQAERAGHIEPAQALALVVQICTALDYAHKNGIVHRDIKPENVLLTRDGKVKIVDFGLAKVLDRAARGLSLTRMSQTMGTPHYMAPEQIEHPKDIDHRADIYSLGVVFYELLTGELPLGRFPLPSHKVTIDVRLDDIVIRTLEKEPDRRYQAASELRTAVENVATTPTPVQRVEQTKDARRSWSPLRWVGAIAAACIVLFAGLSVSLLLSGRHVEIRDPAGDPVPGQALQQARKGTLPAGFSLGPELEGQIAEALRAYWAASPAAPRASVLAQIAPDLLRSGSQVSRLAALGYVFAHGDARDDTDPVRRYDELESRSVEPLELGGEGEVAALRITPDSEAVRGLREELRSRIVGQVGPTLFSREELDAVLFDRMPFDAGPIEIRIARRGAGWHVERRTKSGVSAETFPDLPPRYGRLMDRSLERAPQLQDPMSAPLTASGAQKGVFAPRPQGLGTAHALAWSRAERIVARSATSLLERYGALEAAHASMTEEVVGPTSTVRVKIEEFAAERAALTAELWTILTHAMEQDEVVRVMQRDFDRAVFPYGDQVFDITMTREGEGFRLVERSADGHFDGSFWVKEFPARMRRLLERPK